MKTLKRFLAYTAIGVSIIGIIMALISVIGIWRVNQPLIKSFTAMGVVAESGLEVMDGALQVINPLLTSLQNGMVTVQESGEELKADITQGNPIIDALSLILGEDIQPKIDKTLDTLATIRATVQDVNSAVQTINSLPFVNLKHISQATQDLEDIFDEIADGVEELDQSVDELKVGLSQSVIQPIQDQAVLVEEDLAEAQKEVQELQEEVGGLLQILKVVNPRIPLIISGISTLLSVQLLWGAIAQVAVVYLAWMYLKTGRLGWRDLEDGPDEPASPVS